jgi:putative ABC transport system permease protein
MAQGDGHQVTLVLRTPGDPAAAAPAVRELVAQLDPDLAIIASRSMMSVRQASMARPRFMMVLLLAFAGVGVVLAMVGVYGVISQLARQRAREMSIRLALGATSDGVRWLVVRHGLTLAAIGAIVGLGVAAIATRALQSMLFGVGAIDPVTFLVVPVLLTVTAFVASWIPASRVARADPAVALQAE